MGYKPQTQKEEMQVGASNEMFLTSDEAASLLRIKKSHLYNLTSNRLIKFYKPRGGMMYFLRADLVDWILNNERKCIDNLKDWNHGAE